MEIECRCPHAPYSHAVFAEAQRALGRRSFLLGAAAAAGAGAAAVLLPW
jgi:hypothetical protein